MPNHGLRGGAITELPASPGARGPCSAPSFGITRGGGMLGVRRTGRKPAARRGLGSSKRPRDAVVPRVGGRPIGLCGGLRSMSPHRPWGGIRRAAAVLCLVKYLATTFPVHRAHAESRWNRSSPAALVLLSVGASTATARSGQPDLGKLDSIAGAGVLQNRVIGVVAAVVRGNDALLMKAYGKADVEWSRGLANSTREPARSSPRVSQPSSQRDRPCSATLDRPQRQPTA